MSTTLASFKAIESLQKRAPEEVALKIPASFIYILPIFQEKSRFHCNLGLQSNWSPSRKSSV